MALADRELMLQEFRKAYDRLEAVRKAAKETSDTRALSHAEHNFHAVAEGLARLLIRAEKRAND
ncbi:hypothetical protein Q9K02_11150 [Qipengyuania sp. G39]|uniref:Uncharacterized protein n=1 Tax=Qipengyuania profundimaris TaxID=3067652 RepID=A0ABT9HRA8_9SPHN|nr:hypothetical protein [Qipengyuania sp. G39]MDP4575696.1 hypothetical protein [Qipengyuania sp. G39]